MDDLESLVDGITDTDVELDGKDLGRDSSESADDEHGLRRTLGGQWWCA